MADLITANESGLYCPQGNFYIDPWRSVENAVVTHAHSDHLYFGNAKYLLTTESGNIARTKFGDNINMQLLEYGKKININGVELSFHPAGHILGSAQIRLAHNGSVWVVSGDL